MCPEKEVSAGFWQGVLKLLLLLEHAQAYTGPSSKLISSHSVNFTFQIFDFLKTSITRSCKDLQFLQASKFLQDLFPHQHDVSSVVLEVVQNR